jgi:hypothetical protein
MTTNRIVVIPTLHRTEILALTLEKLSLAQKQRNVEVRIYVDTTTDKRLSEFEYVRDTYFPTADLYHAKPHLKVPSGCWNILHALKGGYESEADFVHLIEEDVLVYPDYFDWMESQTGDYFAACGRYVPRYGQLYTNPGSMLPRASLATVVPHINDSFFADRRAYLDARWLCEEGYGDFDDGLIQRIHRASGLPLRFPDTPKVAHVGFHYYNRTQNYQNKEGGIEQRIARLREILPTVDPSGRYTKDFESFPF